jgi:hypothetical protein
MNERYMRVQGVFGVRGLFFDHRMVRAPRGSLVMPETLLPATGNVDPGDYIGSGIKSRADALANLPSRAR